MFPTFTGNSRRPRNVNLSGQRNTNPWATGATQTIANAQAEREKRQRERNELVATKRIQRVWRGHRERQRTKQQHRQEWDFLYGMNEISDPESLTRALSLLLALFNQSNPADQLRLDQFVRSLAAVGPAEALAGCLETPQWTRLAPLLVEALKRRPISEKPSQQIFNLLVDLVKSRPSSILHVSDQYYNLISGFCDQNVHYGLELPRLAEAITGPLGDRRAYGAFAFCFCTSANLSFLEANPAQIAGLLDLQTLSESVIHAFTQQQHIHTVSRDGLLWLLAHFIALNRALSTSQGSAYLEALYLQLSVVAADIRMRSVRQDDRDEIMSDDESEESELSATTPLPRYVKEQVEFLVDEDGIAELLSRFTSARMSEDASLLAGYTLILLRCFPSHGDDIKMRLFQGDISTEGSSAAILPSVKYFWKAASRADSFLTIAQRPTAVSTLAALLRPNPRRDQDWRTILLFLELYNFLLRVTDEEDFLPAENQIVSEQSPAVLRIRSSGLALSELRQLATFLKNLSFPLYYNLNSIMPSSPAMSRLNSLMGVGPVQPAETQDKAPSPLFAGIMGIDILSLRSSATATMRSLYERDYRRPYLPKGFWLMTSKFDMDGFISAVVLEGQRRDDLDDEENEEESLADNHPEVYGSNPYHTSAGYRLSRAAQIEKQRQLRKAQKEQFLAQAGPKLEILKNMPFAIPFDVRVQIFRQFVHLDKLHRRKGNVDPDRWRLAMISTADAFGGPTSRGRDMLSRHTARIKRGQLFSDALDQFFDLGEGLKEPIQITFIDQFDQPEAGIDGGGVTKEFLTSVVDEAFHASSSDTIFPKLFVANGQTLLYPNPTAFDELSAICRGTGCPEGTPGAAQIMQDLVKRYEFLGRIVGKCMYEGILIDVAFASFFLQKWSLSGLSSAQDLARANFYDLREMDPDLYKGLVGLKDYKGDVADLSLDFTISDQFIDPLTGETRTITRPLRRDGESMPVTNKERPLYIASVVRYRLGQQLMRQNKAFLRGLGTMINPTWLAMFNPLELQRLVGGDSSGIDVNDLRRNTQYSGLYAIGDDGLEHPTVQMFWQVMHSLKDEQRRQVLKYVTSTPRAPLLGFAQLSPAFSIRDAGDDEERLPSTSTCVNLLKLPRYSSTNRLRQKLLYAIQSGAGFDLS